MNVWIVGPIQTKSYFGGVAIFDEELARGFAKLGCQVTIITSQSETTSRFDSNVVVMSGYSYKKSLSLYAEENPDLIIASLGYAKLVPKHTACDSAYFLHGFFNRSYYGFLKSSFATLYQKHLIKRFKYVFANSSFTRMINKEFFDIHTDEVFHLGVTEELHRLSNSINTINREKNSVIFSGRLVSGKKVRKLIGAIILLKERGIDCSIRIAGDGEERAWMESKVAEYDLPVTLIGRVDQRALAEEYKRAEVFVSLNPSEPYGITFVEALLCGCKIVCPTTGGQVEVLQRWPETVAYVNEDDEQDIADGIASLFRSNEEPQLSQNEREEFTYSGVALKMLSFLKSKQEEPAG